MRMSHGAYGGRDTKSFECLMTISYSIMETGKLIGWNDGKLDRRRQMDQVITCKGSVYSSSANTLNIIISYPESPSFFVQHDAKGSLIEISLHFRAQIYKKCNHLKPWLWK